MNHHDVVIVSRARTPIGRFQGAFVKKTAPELGSVAIKSAIERAGLTSNDIQEVIMGQVLTAGTGQAPARQASLGAEIPNSVPCMTINKVCGSGLKAVMLGAQSIQLGESQIVVAGGMESMSNTPYLLPKARTGFRLGNSQVVDAILQDGLLDPYSKTHMGVFGDQCASEFKFTREQQDAFAKRSYERALEAQKSGWFKDEIIPVEIENDEEPADFKPEKMPLLKPVFGKEGTVTAANASKISDGAAAIILMNAAESQRRGIKALAKIKAMATYAQDPAHFTTAPIEAIRRVAKKAEISIDDIDYFEINEAFSTVTMAAIEALKLNPNHVNPWGGAVALGHPIGCSGARILCTLLSVMARNQAKLGCAAICLGGGEAVSVLIESV